MAAGWDIVSDGPAPPDTDTANKKGWDVVSDIPAESAAARRDRHRAMAAKAPSFGSAAKQVGNLALDTAGAGLGAVAGGVTGVASDVLGQPDATHDALVKQAHDVFANADPHSDIAAVSDALGHTAPLQAVAGALHSAGGALDNAVGPTISHAIKRVAGDVTNAAPAAGVMRPAAAAADAADLAPLAETPDAMLHAAGYKVNTKNMTGAAAEPGALAQLGESAAGPGARADRILHNRTISNDWGATDIGLPKGTVLTPKAVAQAESVPGATYEKIEGALPQRAQVSEDTQAALKGAVGPDVLGRQLLREPELEGVVERLTTEPMNAKDLKDKISALRQEGYKQIQHTEGAQVDVKKQAIGDAQLKLADALESELDNRVAHDVPALNGEYQAARKQFAKINVVKAALRGGYDIDPAVVARIGAKRPLDGGLKIIADAHTHAPNDVRVRVPEEAGQHPLVGPIGGLSAAAGAAAFHHPIAAGVIAAGSLVRPTARAIMRHVGNDAPVAEAGAKGALGDYFGRETEGFHPSQAKAPELALQPPPGNVIEPGQRSLLATGDSGPIREQGGLPPHPDLHMQEGPAFEPAQRPLPLGEAAVPESAAPKGGPQIQESVEISPMREHHVMPGSTLITEGGTRAEPERFISITPQEDGTLRVTNTHVEPTARGKGMGKKNILDAIDYADSKGVPLTGDTSVKVDNLRAIFSLKDAGVADFDFRTPEIEAKARRMVKDNGKGKDGSVLKDGGMPVTKNWRRVKKLGDAIGGK